MESSDVLIEDIDNRVMVMSDVRERTEPSQKVCRPGAALLNFNAINMSWIYNYKKSVFNT